MLEANKFAAVALSKAKTYLVLRSIWDTWKSLAVHLKGPVQASSGSWRQLIFGVYVWQIGNHFFSLSLSLQVGLLEMEASRVVSSK